MLPSQWHLSFLLLLNAFGKIWNMPPLFKQMFQSNVQKKEKENPNPTRMPNVIVSLFNCSLTVCIVLLFITLHCFLI